MYIRYFLVLFLALPFSVAAQTDSLQAVMENIMQKGVDFEDKGNFKAAIEQYKKAAALAEKNTDVFRPGFTTSVVGYAYSRANDYKSANRYLKKAIRQFEQDTDTLHEDYAQILYDIGILSYFHLNESPDTVCLYSTRALTAAQNLYKPTDAVFGRYLGAVGICRLVKEDYKDAKKWLLKSYGLLNTQAVDFPGEIIQLHDYLGTAYSQLQMHDSAVYYFIKKLELGKKLYQAGSQPLAECYYRLAYALNWAGMVDSSVVYLDSAAITYKSMVRPDEKAEFYYRCGEFAYQKQKYELARHLFIQSATHLANNNIKVSLEGSAWLYVAATYGADMKLSESKPYFDKACELFTRDLGAQNPRTLQVCNMAKSVPYMNPENFDITKLFSVTDKSQLEAAFSKLLDASQTINMGTPYLTTLLQQSRENPEFNILPQALLAVVTNRPKDAVKIVQRFYCAILPGFTDSLNTDNDPPAVSFTGKRTIFLVAMLVKAAALDMAAQADKNPDYLLQACRILAKCDTLVSIARLDAEQTDLEQWSGTVTNVYNEWLSVSAQAADVTNDNSYYEQTFLASERLKAYALLKTADSLTMKKLAPAELLQQEDSLQRTIRTLERKLAEFYQLHQVLKTKKDTINRDAIANPLFLAKANRVALRTKLQNNHPKYWELKADKPTVTLKNLMQALDDSTAMISYSIAMPDLLNILVITKYQNGVYVHKSVPGLAKLVETVSSYLNPYNTKRNKEAYTKAARTLYQALIGNLPGNIRQLIIIPDGVLHNLPFEALLTADATSSQSFKQYPFLIKNYAVSYGYSATLTYPLLENSRPGYYNKFALGYGPKDNIDFKTIQPILQAQGLKYDLLDGDQATKSDLFKRKLEDYQVVHIAGHGFAEPSKVELASILIGDGEKVYYGDLYNLPMEVDLVLLLSCLSGKGALVSGEGMIGMNRALYVAGVRNLLLYRDLLNDESNGLFCSEFYKNIVGQDFTNYAQALQYARLQLIGRSEYADPAYWAGYYLIGR